MTAARGLAHALVFFASFTLEVTVNASEAHLSEGARVQQEPANCIKGDAACAVENLGDKGFDLEVGSTVVTLDTRAIVIRETRNSIRLVKGTAWIQAKSPFTVKTEFGDASGDGEFWISRTKSDFTVSPTKNEVQLQPRGTGETLTVSAGLQNTVGAIGFDGKASVGIPMPIPFKDHLIRWGRLYHGPKKDFEPMVDQFHDRWVAASEASAEINKALYDRKVASVDEERAQKAAAEAKVQAERAKWKKLFRSRALGE